MKRRRNSETESQSSKEDVSTEDHSFNISQRNVDLLQNLSRWESLVKLELECDVNFCIPSAGCFPSLKTIQLDVRRPNCKFLKNLFAICPVLENLTIDGDLYHIKPERRFKIYIPTLKRLSFYLHVDIFQFSSNYDFIIRTPNLEDLTIHNGSLDRFEIDELHSLRSADLCIGYSKYFNKWGEVTELGEDFRDRLAPILEGIRYARFLNLSASTTAALSAVYDRDLPGFPNLVRLELGIDHFHQWKLLPYFLRNSNLEFLVLNKESEQILMCEAELDSYEDCHRWNPPEIKGSSFVPCVPPRLKEIRMINLWRYEDDAGVVKFLLENCKGLEKMSIEFDEYSRGEELDEDMIERFPRASDICKLEFV